MSQTTGGFTIICPFVENLCIYIGFKKTCNTNNI